MNLIVLADSKNGLIMFTLKIEENFKMVMIYSDNHFDDLDKKNTIFDFILINDY